MEEWLAGPMQVTQPITTFLTSKHLLIVDFAPKINLNDCLSSFAIHTQCQNEVPQKTILNLKFLSLTVLCFGREF